MISLRRGAHESAAVSRSDRPPVCPVARGDRRRHRQGPGHGLGPRAVVADVGRDDRYFRDIPRGSGVMQSDQTGIVRIPTERAVTPPRLTRPRTHFPSRRVDGDTCRARPRVASPHRRRAPYATYRNGIAPIRALGCPDPLDSERRGGPVTETILQRRSVSRKNGPIGSSSRPSGAVTSSRRTRDA